MFPCRILVFATVGLVALTSESRSSGPDLVLPNSLVSKSIEARQLGNLPKNTQFRLNPEGAREIHTRAIGEQQSEDRRSSYHLTLLIGSKSFPVASHAHRKDLSAKERRIRSLHDLVSFHGKLKFTTSSLCSYFGSLASPGYKVTQKRPLASLNFYTRKPLESSNRISDAFHQRDGNFHDYAIEMLGRDTSGVYLLVTEVPLRKLLARHPFRPVKRKILENISKDTPEMIDVFNNSLWYALALSADPLNNRNFYWMVGEILHDRRLELDSFGNQHGQLAMIGGSVGVDRSCQIK